MLDWRHFIGLGYFDYIIGTFLIFNGMGILSLIIALIIRGQGMVKL